MSTQKLISIEAPNVVMDVFNVAYGSNTTLFGLFESLNHTYSDKIM